MPPKTLKFCEKYLTLCFWASSAAERSNMVSMVFVWSHEGPRYLKLGGRVIYRLSDVEAFEREVQSFSDELSAEG